MKASQMITKLNKIIADEGDLTLFDCDDHIVEELIVYTSDEVIASGYMMPDKFIRIERF